MQFEEEDEGVAVATLTDDDDEMRHICRIEAYGFAFLHLSRFLALAGARELASISRNRRKLQRLSVRIMKGLISSKS